MKLLIHTAEVEYMVVKEIKSRTPTIALISYNPTQGNSLRVLCLYSKLGNYSQSPEGFAE